MSKTGKIRSVLLLSGIFLLSTSLCPCSRQNTAQRAEVAKPQLTQEIRSKVLEIIKYAQDIPGLKAEESSSLREKTADIWNALVDNCILEISGTDKDVRPHFVAIQGMVEQVLASELQKEVKVLKCIIHTPMPATPLCTTGEISRELVDPSIEVDPARLFTVKARTTILRDYLFKGGDLYSIYPKEGLKKRTEEQLEIYQQELMNYPTHLFDLPLECETIPTDLIGATYFFKDQSGHTFVFAIKIAQANDPKEVADFGLWFGPVDHPAVKQRIQSVSHYLEQQHSTILKTAQE